MRPVGAGDHLAACHFAERISQGVLAEAVAEQPEIQVSDAVDTDGLDPEPPQHVVDGGPDD